MINTFNFQIQKISLIKYKQQITIYYLDYSSILKLTFSDLKKFKLCHLMLSKKFPRIKCILCDSEFLKGFSIVPINKFKKLTLLNWNIICDKCIDNIQILTILKLWYNLEDITLDLFQFFINLFKKEDKLCL